MATVKLPAGWQLSLVRTPPKGITSRAGVPTNLRDSFQSRPEHSTEQFARAGKMEFRGPRLGLRLRHALYRLRKPRHPQSRHILLLLLDPVQYEIAPLLRSGKASGIRQKLSRHLVTRAFGQAAYELTAKTIEKTFSVEPERLMIQMDRYRKEEAEFLAKKA